MDTGQEEAHYTTVSADLSGLRAVTVHFFCSAFIQIPLESRLTTSQDEAPLLI